MSRAGVCTSWTGGLVPLGLVLARSISNFQGLLSFNLLLSWHNGVELGTQTGDTLGKPVNFKCILSFHGCNLGEDIMVLVRHVLLEHPDSCFEDLGGVLPVLVIQDFEI